MIRNTNRWLILALLVILLCGTLLIFWTAQRSDTLQREKLLTETRLVKSGIPVSDLQQLSGSKTDLALPGYPALKEELIRIRHADPQIRFAYLMGQRPDKTVFFFVDSEYPASADYSPPGEIYPEASATLQDVFVSGDEITEGPLTDRWGTWVSGFVPIRDPRTGNVIAVLGTDVDARDWNMQIIIACGPAILGTLLLVFLVLIFFYVLERNDRELQMRNESEAVLRESEARFRMLFEENPSPIFIFEIPAGSIAFVNKKFLSLMETSPDQILGKRYADLGILQDPADQDRLTALIMQNNLVNDLEFRIINKNGTKGIVLISGRMVTMKGKPYCFTIMQDVSELKAVEEEMHYYSSELRKYSTMLARTNDKLNLLNNITRHDINNQLTIIAVFLGMIRLKYSDPALQEIIEKVIFAAGNIQTQIFFTRDYQDVGVQSPQWFNVRKIITAVAAQLPLSGISVNVKFDNLELYADPLFEKVFYTLLENAVRHGKTVTSVEFSCNRVGDLLVVSYQDNGIGIPEEYKEAIFDRTYFHHTGFGLYLSRTILSITEMEIRETGIPGKGARFEISVPKGAYRTP